VSAILTPPLAFLIYIPLILVIVWIGRQLAGTEHGNGNKSSVYGSGEEAPMFTAAPGYKPFFLVALFFAILHLGMLVLGLAGQTWIPVIYLVGLAVALVALILG
jgi:NADH:ubiquinone oxidoreductase subunit 3 (subunit A)